MKDKQTEINELELEISKMRENRQSDNTELLAKIEEMEKAKDLEIEKL